MKSVLLVEDDPSLRTYLQRGLQALRFTVKTAANGNEAIERLSSPTDIVVADLQMPDLSGFELVAHLSRTRPRLPIIGMTSGEASNAELLHAGKLVCLPKPVDYHTLGQTMSRLLNPAAGLVSGISPGGFLQVLRWEKKSCSLSVRSRGREGRLFVVDGNLVDAETSGENGASAALNMLAWDAAEIEISPPETRPVTITATLDELMATVTRLTLDTADALGGTRPALGPSLGPKAGSYAGRSRTSQTSTITQEFTIDRSAILAGLNNARKREETPMANAKESMEKLATIEGFVGACLVDSNSGMMLSALGGGGALNLEVAAAANTEVVRAKRKAMVQLKLNDAIEDILITLGKQYHLIRPIASKDGLFVYLVLDRAKANLAMGRHVLGDMEKALVL